MYLMCITGHFYKQALFSFTSGTSKGTSSPLFLRISATIRRVLSLGMMFSSCIFVHTASAFRELFVSSEIKILCFNWLKIEPEPRVEVLACSDF